MNEQSDLEKTSGNLDDIPTIIHVDRSIRASKQFPNDPEAVSLKPELENEGPEEFDIRHLSLWQNDQDLSNYQLYKFLQSFDFHDCLNLRDLEEILPVVEKIIEKDRGAFRSYFPGINGCPAWKSVILTKAGYMYLPQIGDFSSHSNPSISWFPLGYCWDGAPEDDKEVKVFKDKF